MFLSDKIIFLELQKTGCSHIRKLLSELVEGELIGIHNQATSDLFTAERAFYGSVRNPWDWYISLWAFGCGNQGKLFHQLTRSTKSWKNNPYAAFLALLHGGHPKAWRETYQDANDAEGFRTWLSMIHDPQFVDDIGEGYGFSPFSKVCGVMSFRYLKLFCTKKREKTIYGNLATLKDIQEYENQNCFIDYFIRNENLEADFFSSLEQHGINFSEEVKSNVLEKPKTNSSSRKRSVEYYYDDASVELVAERERLIIEKFGYQKPSL